MTPDKNDLLDEPEDHGILGDAVADSSVIGVPGTRTSQLRVPLPRGYEDLDDDADVVDDSDDLARGTIVLELPADDDADDDTTDEPEAEIDEPEAETGEIEEDAVAAARARIGEALVAARAAIAADSPLAGVGGTDRADAAPDASAAPEAGEAAAEERATSTGAGETIEPADAAQPDATIEPPSAPEPEPAPVPEPAPGSPSAPEPQSTPEPEPPSAPEPEPRPEPEPQPTPEPAPAAAPRERIAEVPRPADAAIQTDAHAADDTEKDEPDVSPADHHPTNDDAPGQGAAAAPGESAALARTTRFVAQPVESKRVNASGAESADQLTSDRLVEPGRHAKVEPEGAAWRSLVFRATRGLINPGDSRSVRARKQLSAQISSPLHGGARFVPVVSRKGGVGKTTVTTLLGMALADARDDRIIAVDANPDRGTLAERVAGRSGRTVRDVVRDHARISGYGDISDLVSRDETRLDVLASDTDPHVAQAFDDSDYRTVAQVAAHYYSIVLTDTGTGIVHSVMEGTLDLADELVVVAGLSVDEARLASETLTWLEAHGRGDLVERAVVVLNQSSPGTPLVRLAELESHFASRVRAVVRLPYDPAVATGGAIDWAELRRETRQGARELAARVVEGLRGTARSAAVAKGGAR